ncbi:hypothetical protein FHS83_000118 [Rhizomicrobium palustre]|uniref:Uncharacterized protein n=1 Tax=Rhizomicrobium palustre TaxID=189966 RepID=A0A846MUP6_9PROT|nr:hypothetical protein [Rhizomicrobium palustre]NIK86800.1 hypothetical protein [Rhizomicrobium palustre]
MSYTITFRRPELWHVLTTMTVPSQADTLAQIHRLEDLGYKIITVIPPLDVHRSPQDPGSRMPASIGLREAKTSIRHRIE